MRYPPSSKVGHFNLQSTKSPQRQLHLPVDDNYSGRQYGVYFPVTGAKPLTLLPPGGEELILFKFLFGRLHSKTFVGQFQYGGMMNEAINGGSGGHGIFEDAVPLTEDEVARDH